MYEQKTNVQDTTLIHLYETKSLQRARGRFGNEENSEKQQSTPTLKWGGGKPPKHPKTIQPCENVFKFLEEPGNKAFQTLVGTQTAA